MIDMSDGSVHKEDAKQIRDMLQKEIENGNRFVSFLSGKEGLTKEDFSVFKSSFAAHEHAHEISNDYDIYVVRSTATVEKEMSRLLEMAQNERQDEPKDNQRNIKSSRDQELSR